jgi:hypothetical protein
MLPIARRVHGFCAYADSRRPVNVRPLMPKS